MNGTQLYSLAETRNSTPSPAFGLVYEGAILVSQCCGFALVSLRIRIQVLILMRIQIRTQGAKPKQIHADPDPVQTKSQNVEFLHEKYTFEVPVGNR
jgi:hypothetical protein